MFDDVTGKPLSKDNEFVSPIKQVNLGIVGQSDGDIR